MSLSVAFVDKKEKNKKTKKTHGPVYRVAAQLKIFLPLLHETWLHMLRQTWLVFPTYCGKQYASQHKEGAVWSAVCATDGSLGLNHILFTYSAAVYRLTLTPAPGK